VVSSAPRTIGRALEERRRELELGHEAAAELIGVSRSTYTGYERDARRISPEVLRPLAHFLDVGVVEILELYGATCVFQARRVLMGNEAPTTTTPFAEVRARRLSRDDTTIVERVYFDTTPEKVPTVALAIHDERVAHVGSSVVLAAASGATKKNRKKIKKKLEKKGNKKGKAKSTPKDEKLTADTLGLTKGRRDESSVKGSSTEVATPTAVLVVSSKGQKVRAEAKLEKKREKKVKKKTKKTKKSR
jgi:transcriptional regulator with XRE-family HTH domain